MTTIVDSLRKHQKMIVLGAALAVITLYIIPVDQIASAITTSERVNAIFQRHIDRFIADDRVPQHVIDHLILQQYKVVSHLQSKGL